MAKPERIHLRTEVADSRSCSLETRRRLMRQLPFFQSLPSDEITRIGNLFWERGFRPGEVIYQWGEPPAHLYVLATGKVHLVRPSENHRNVLCDVLGPGEFFGTLVTLFRCL